MEDDQDHISQLPDSILRKILSCLKTREAAGTSSVSTRWWYLWTTPTNLVFDLENMLEGNDDSLLNLHQLSVLERCIIMMKRSVSFVCSVNHFLSQLREDHRIEKFKVYFTFRHNRYGANDLDHWVRFAIEREAQEIELCLLENYFSAPNKDELYVFPCDFLVHNWAAGEFKSSLNCLRLAYCILAPSRYTFSCFRTITTLDLKKVNLVSYENTQNLLYNCHDIEWLSFSECLNINYLKIEHPICLQLKYLNVSDCQQLKAIEIKGIINLETVEYKGGIIEFMFYNAPRLRTVFSHPSDWTAIPGKVWPLLRLPITVPQLETLILECNFYFYMDGLMREKRLPPFPNLKRLIILKVAIMQEDLSWIATILKACLALQRFELHQSSFVYIDEKLKKENWPSSYPHDHLKQILISGIHGFMSEIAVAVYLLKNATALEKMTMDPRPRVYLGNGKWHVSEACEGWTTMARERVHQHLIQEGCPPDKLLIL